MNKVATPENPIGSDKRGDFLKIVGLLSLSAVAAAVVGSQTANPWQSDWWMVVGMTFVSALLIFTTLLVPGKYWTQRQITTASVLSLFTILAPSIIKWATIDPWLSGATNVILVLIALFACAWYFSGRKTSEP